MQWHFLPWEAGGVGVRELALLAGASMRASSFERSLRFTESKYCVKATFAPALEPQELSAIQLPDFFFENSATQALLHGRWESAQTEKTSSLVRASSYRHNIKKEKTA